MPPLNRFRCPARPRVEYQIEIRQSAQICVPPSPTPPACYPPPGRPSAAAQVLVGCAAHTTALVKAEGDSLKIDNMPCS